MSRSIWYTEAMPRRRKAWLPGGTGRRKDRPDGFYVLWYDYARDGRRISRSKHFQTQKLARQWCRQYNARQDLEAVGSIIPISLKDASVEFVGGCSALANSTVSSYRGAITHLYEIVGNRNISEITGQMIDEFIGCRLAVVRPATVDNNLRSLCRFFRWCVDRGYAEFDPIRLATSKPKHYQTRDCPMVTDEELDRLVEVLDTEDRKLAVQLAITTGLDRGVIHRLTSREVDLKNGCIRLQRPKTSSRLIIPLHPDVADQLAAKIAQAEPSEPLFSGIEPNRRKHLDWWHLAANQAGIPELRFDDLRALASSRMQRVLPLSQVQKILGHSSPQITSRHYSPEIPDIAKRLAQLPIPGLQRT